MCPGSRNDELKQCFMCITDNLIWRIFLDIVRGFSLLMVILICTLKYLKATFRYADAWITQPSILNWCENPNRKNRRAEYWKRKEIRTYFLTNDRGNGFAEFFRLEFVDFCREESFINWSYMVLSGGSRIMFYNHLLFFWQTFIL